MKLEITQPGTKEYYNEVFYIFNRYKKYLKKPYMTSINIYTYIALKVLFKIFCLLYCYMCYKVLKNMLFIFFAGYFTFSLLISIMNIIKIKRRIKLLTFKENKRVIKLTDEVVEYMDEFKSYRLKWYNIEHILIKKYSIAFLAKLENNLIITIPIEYKDEVLKYLKKHNLEDLIRGDLNDED